jgi:hypothetical protein
MSVVPVGMLLCGITLGNAGEPFWPGVTVMAVWDKALPRYSASRSWPEKGV